MPLTNLTVFAWLPSASPSALTYSPDFFKSSSRVVMNLIIATIHSLPIVANPSSADPNVMIMYFIASLLGNRIRRFRDVVEAAERFSTSSTSHAALTTGPRPAERERLGPGGVLQRRNVRRGRNSSRGSVTDRRRDLLCQLRAHVPHRPDPRLRSLHVPLRLDVPCVVVVDMELEQP